MTSQQLIETWISTSPEKVAFPSSEDGSFATVGANFLGIDNSDRLARGREIYADPKNLPTAVASIMNHAQRRAHFHPAEDTPEEVARTYNEYIRQIKLSPFFHFDKNEQIEQTYQSKNYNKLIDDVVKLYDGITEADRNKLKQRIANMGKAEFGGSSGKQWKNIFSQATIHIEEQLAKVYIYSTSLYMKHEEGKAEVKIQAYTVTRREYIVLDGLIRAHAERLGELDSKIVEEWRDISSTPERNGATLCFEVNAVQNK